MKTNDISCVLTRPKHDKSDHEWNMFRSIFKLPSAADIWEIYATKQHKLKPGMKRVWNWHRWNMLQRNMFRV